MYFITFKKQSQSSCARYVLLLLFPRWGNPGTEKLGALLGLHSWASNQDLTPCEGHASLPHHRSVTGATQGAVEAEALGVSWCHRDSSWAGLACPFCAFLSLDCTSSNPAFSSVLIPFSAFPHQNILREKPDHSFIPKLHGVNLNQCTAFLRGACMLSLITLYEMKGFVSC